MNIDMIRGDTLNIQFEIESDTVIHLTDIDFKITFSVKYSATDTNYVFVKNKTAATELSDNNFVLRIAPEDTEDLIPGFYYYDLQLNIGNDTYTIALGMLQIIRDITLPPAVLPTFIYPDVNGDGIADETDAGLIIQANSNIVAGLPSGLTEEQEDIADCDRNGLIEALDASLLYGFISDCNRGLYTNNAVGWNEYMSIHYSS